MNKVVYVFAIIFLVICLFVTSMDVYSQHVVRTLSDNVIRLHVVANSNHPQDQELKLKVRDNVLTYLKQNTQGFPVDESDLSKAEFFIKSRLDEINEVAQQTVLEHGYDYPTVTSYGDFYFPVKEYDNFALPSGLYSALRIEIGQSCGENWWCVLYPPLCFPEGSLGLIEKEKVQLFVQSISDENAKVIFLDSSGEPNIRFKIVEFFQSIKKRIQVDHASK